MYRCIIIDDEEHAIQGLKKYLEAVPILELVACFSDAVVALTELKKLDPVNLILLDVDMPGISGIELSREIKGNLFLPPGIPSMVTMHLRLVPMTIY